LVTQNYRGKIKKPRAPKPGGIRSFKKPWTSRPRGKGLRAQVGDMDVNAGVDVVKHVPASVIGIFVNDKIVSAIPAPVRAKGPIPGRDFKKETARQPETTMVAIDADGVVAKGGTKVLEAAVFIWVVDVVALIVGPVVAVPMVIVDVGNGVDVAARMALRFRLGTRLLPGRRRRGNAPLVGARRIV
jgi:hypothetical protein